MQESGSMAEPWVSSQLCWELSEQIPCSQRSRPTALAVPKAPLTCLAVPSPPPQHHPERAVITIPALIT